MVNKLCPAFVFLVLIANITKATIFTPIDPTQVKRVELSSLFQNRIAVKEGRISQLVHPGCDIDINLNDEIGQVFIFPLTNYPRPTSLTVVTDSGSVQDFELVFVEKAGEIVILEEPVPDEYDFKDLPPCPDNPDYRIQLVRKILKGNIPEGLVACDVSPESIILKCGIKAVLIAKFISGEETIFLWSLENVSNRSITINESEVNFQHGSWVYIDNRCLQKREETVAMIGVEHEKLR